MGVNKVLMFVRSINRKERMTIGIKLKIKTVQMASSRIGPKSKEYAGDMMRSGRGHSKEYAGDMTRSGGQKMVTSDDRLPPKEESSM